MFFLRNNTEVKKIVRFDKRAEKEFKKFPEAVQVESKVIILVLCRDGKLIEPFGKKIDYDLFEIRIKYRGQWRLFYAYLIDNCVMILSAFHKKTQKIPIKEIQIAKKRLKFYKI